ncbi:MAG: aldehyde dehydrogenase family protein, partial [Acidimicrobiia bacterium]
AELVPWLAGHMDVNALDLAGASQELAGELAGLAVENVKRVVRPRSEVDWATAQSPYLIAAFAETKTVWHPKGV